VRKRRRQTRSRAPLVMLAIAAIALMGVPRFGHYQPPEGAIEGIVLGPDGAPSADVEMALFNDRGPSLLELTRTDDWGRFAFHQAPRRYHVFARPEPRSMRVGTWARARTRAAKNEVRLTLGRGAPITVRVTDEKGGPLEGIEVRAYDATAQPAVVARHRTSAEGEASLVVPMRAHLAILGDQDHVAHWRLAESIPEQGRTFAVTLERAVALAGRVVDERGDPLPGVVVTAWERGGLGAAGGEPGGESWRGYARTDAEGRWVLRTGGGPCLLRAVDPTRRHLPLEQEHTSEESRSLTLELRSGSPLDVVCESAEAPVPSRVWVYSRATGTWSWGSPTDRDGRLRTVVEGDHGIVAEPLSRERLQVQRWRGADEAGEVRLAWPTAAEPN
jgi:protocatechuate 3,4-dioxygenase beta subunit